MAFMLHFPSLLQHCYTIDLSGFFKRGHTGVQTSSFHRLSSFKEPRLGGSFSFTQTRSLSQRFCGRNIRPLRAPDIMPNPVPKPLSHQRSCILRLDRRSSLHAMYKVHELRSQQLDRLKEEETLALAHCEGKYRLCTAQVSTVGRPTAPRAPEVRSVAESCSKTAFSHLLTMSCSITNHTNVGRCCRKAFSHEQQLP